ncbi:MAG: A/G-specific adenine glycosylase [Acidobacteria bacterium]|nr:A/G-specific adenine glycosylase [Acidobacteriota bacterium]
MSANPVSPGAFRRELIAWYERNRRDLPWRRTQDPYAIWLSEIMLQQTRVAAVIPYYERFLDRFPNPAALASAPEEEVLSLWAGLGYYSRARNLIKAARQIQQAGAFPRTFDGIRALAGVGDYTAAAVASIAFSLPHAVVDGNVLRVISRLNNDPSDISALATRQRMQIHADRILDRSRPALFNQAIMELGATVCLPRQPQCTLCPVAGSCEGRRAGRQNELPVKLRNHVVHCVERTLLVIPRGDSFLMWQRPAASAKLAGFWELPEPEHLPGVAVDEPIGSFRHAITNHQYVFRVTVLTVRKIPKHMSWTPDSDDRFPFSTTARKAISLYRKIGRKR